MRHSAGRSGSGWKSFERPVRPRSDAPTCQLTQFGPPRSRLYESEYSGFSTRKSFGVDVLRVAWLGIPSATLRLFASAGDWAAGTGAAGLTLPEEGIGAMRPQ